MIGLRKVLADIKRASGRTTEIYEYVKAFLFEHPPEKDALVIMCKTRHVAEEYTRKFSQEYEGLHAAYFTRFTKDLLESKTNGNRVMFCTRERGLRGISIHDIIFDTPEFDLYDMDGLQEWIPRLRP